MPGVSALMALLAGVLVLWVTARSITASSRSPRRKLDGAGPAVRLLCAVAVGVTLALLAPATSEPMYVAAAAVAAIATGAAIGIGLEIGTAFAEPAYGLPWLRPLSSPARGGISAEAGAAAAAAAALTAALAFGLRLLGPSDGGPVFLAAILAMLFERWLDGAWQPRGAARVLPATLAGLLGAGAGAIWVILLP